LIYYNKDKTENGFTKLESKENSLIQNKFNGIQNKEFIGKKTNRNEITSKDKENTSINKIPLYSKIFEEEKEFITNDKNYIKLNTIKSLENQGLNLNEDYNIIQKNSIDDFSPKIDNSETNKLDFDPFNQIQEDFLNFDYSDGGIFSNKEITFDENSQNEDNGKYNTDNKDSVISNDFSTMNKTTIPIINESQNKKDIINLDGLIISNYNNNLIKNDKNKEEENKKYYGFSSNNKINEDEFIFENKSMINLKKFFMHNNSIKNDYHTIKSIDESTTVSTQFTKEKNLLNNETRKFQTSNKDKNNADGLDNSSFVRSNNSIRYLTDKYNDKVNNNETNGKEKIYLNKNLLDIKSIQKNTFKEYNLEKEGINFNSSLNKLLYEKNVFSTRNKKDKCTNPKKILSNRSLDIIKSIEFNKIINTNNEEKNYEMSEAYTRRNKDSNNIGKNNLYKNSSKEKKLNEFSLANDIKKTFNNNFCDNKTKEIFKNLLATAKYFDLD
jgi:hypothetical protein